MSKIIICIHGLGNKPQKKILEKWWQQAIQDGLKISGNKRIFFKFKLVYWAHFLHPEPLDPNEKDEKHHLFLENPYVPAKQFEKKKPDRLRQKALDYLEKQMDNLFLNSDLSFNFSKVTDLIIHHFFRDLEIYYSSDCIRTESSDSLARDVIREELVRILRKHRRKQILLIGHSMGSIIAYDVLTQLVPDIKIDTFITIGSPLGLPIIMSKIISEQNEEMMSKGKLCTPENVVRNWYNFSDLRDKVAINYNLRDDYEKNQRGIRPIDKIVFNDYEYNGEKNPHKSYGYLRTPEMAEVINEFLNFGRTKLNIWLHERVNKLKANLRKLWRSETEII